MDHLPYQLAVELAARPYNLQIFKDETTDETPIYIAKNPELQGCVSQGQTIEEVVKNLTEARIDYIYFLLVDGLTVPAPAHR